MPWVRSEYAGELAVVSAWLAALLPWNITYSTFEIGQREASAVFLRFPFVQIRYLFGVGVPDRVRIDHPIGAKALVEGTPVLTYDLWIAGSAIFLIAVLLSVAMYVAEERVTALLPVSPVRMMGVLLAVSAAAWSVTTVTFLTRGDFGGGIPIPIGLLVLYLLAGMLLTVELAPSPDDVERGRAAA